MKAVAIISQFCNDESTQWQFDKIMSAIAYDMELKVVFMPGTEKQLIQNIAWKSLALYGVYDVYIFNASNPKNMDINTSQIDYQIIDTTQLISFIQQADLIL